MKISKSKWRRRRKIRISKREIYKFYRSSEITIWNATYRNKRFDLEKSLNNKTYFPFYPDIAMINLVPKLKMSQYY